MSRYKVSLSFDADNMVEARSFIFELLMMMQTDLERKDVSVDANLEEVEDAEYPS